MSARAAANPGEVKSFLDNRRRLAELESSAARDKAALAELRARSELRSDVARSLLEGVREASNEAAELRDLVETQKSIPGFLIAPRDVYLRKCAEIRELEGRLQQIDGASAAASAESTPRQRGVAELV